VLDDRRTPPTEENLDCLPAAGRAAFASKQRWRSLAARRAENREHCSWADHILVFSRGAPHLELPVQALVRRNRLPRRDNDGIPSEHRSVRVRSGPGPCSVRKR
jgi:hypothetical protein